MKESHYTSEGVTSHIQLSHGTHSEIIEVAVAEEAHVNELWHTYE